jgi:hypothetical protein
MWIVVVMLVLGITGQKPDSSEKKPCMHSSSQAEQSQKVLGKYPKQWGVAVAPGTKLDNLRQQMEKEANLLPAKDLEDRTPIPAWFRVYLRKNNPNLPTSGAYQYPRTSLRLLEYLASNPQNAELPKSSQ